MCPQQQTTSHSNWSLGIDGGRTGAAVLVCSQSKWRLVVEWVYRKRKAGKVYVVTNSRTEREKVVKHSWEIGHEIRSLVSMFASQPLESNGLLVNSEDIYVGRNFKTSVELAKFCGSLVGQLDALDKTGSATWVKAEQWRRELIGLKSFTRRAEAKEASIKLVPKIVSNLGNYIKERRSIDHITDAAGIAAWGLLSRR